MVQVLQTKPRKSPRENQNKNVHFKSPDTPHGKYSKNSVNEPCNHLPELHYVQRREVGFNKTDSGSRSSLDKGKEGMPNPGSYSRCENHYRAICDEVGERLRVFLLDRSDTPAPPRIQALLLRLQLNELKEPVPSTDRASQASTAA
jgi:hypothetical protein